MARASGFTLIELVLVMVVISVGLLGLTSLFSSNTKALTTNETMQQAAQYAQECAERVMAVRRDLGFSSTSISNTMCDSLGTISGYTRSVNVGTSYAGSSGSCNGYSTCTCPSGATCKDVSITVTSTSNSSLSASITLMLANY